MSHRTTASSLRRHPPVRAAALLTALLAAAAPARPGGTDDGAGADAGRRAAQPGRDTSSVDEPWFCGAADSVARDGYGGGSSGSAPSRDLYCQELLASPRGGDARGVVQLAPAASPFGAPLTRDGRFRYRLSMRLRNLPDPSELGPYTTYVAWAAAPTLRPMVRLGEVGEGLHRLTTVELNKFLVLVTAERTADLEERDGPVVLRAQSPSMRMQPHDLPFGFMRGEEPGQDDAGAKEPDRGARGRAADRAGGRAGAPPDAAVRWTPPPMPPDVPMSPPVAPLRPPTAPFLPAAEGGAGDAGPAAGRAPAADAPEGGEAPPPADGANRARRPSGDGDLPKVTPRTVERLEDGDTLRLTARRVRREIGDRSYVMYGYNGQYPGPLLRVPEHAEVTVIFENRIGRPSTIHWHGVRLENRFDGVPGVTQELVEPGESFVYRVRFPDAGIYWYHPHHREDLQQDLGLYGNMLVEPAPGGSRPAAPLGGPRAPDLRDRPAGDDFTYGGYFGPVNREEVLMLDDLLVAEPGGLVPWGEDAVTHALMGRFGNLMLVNGRPRYRLQVTEGEVVRFYLTNAAGTRIFNLSFGDLPLKVVASDLSRYERPVRSPNVTLAPAERYVVEVQFDEPGTVPLVNRVQALNHVYGDFSTQVDTLGVVEVEAGEPPEDHGTAFGQLEPNREVSRDIRRYRDAFDRPVDHTLELTVEVDSLPFPVGSLVRKDSIYFHPVEAAGTMPRMNWVTTSDRVRWILRDPDTGRENMEIDWRFRVGEVVKIRLRNRRRATHAMQHPIHIHGQRFLVLSRNGRRADNLVWKDTAIVPAGTTATLLLELTNPGEWMVHCHIAEHLGSGMKTTFEVAAGDSVALRARGASRAAPDDGAGSN